MKPISGSSPDEDMETDVEMDVNTEKATATDASPTTRGQQAIASIARMRNTGRTNALSSKMAKPSVKRPWMDGEARRVIFPEIMQ